MSLFNLMAEKPSAMDGKEFGFKDRRPGRDPGGAEGGSSSAFSTPRWRQSNSGPRGFIAHCSERKSISDAVPVSPVSLISSQLGKNSGGSNDVDQSSIGWQPRKWIRPCSLLSKATTAEATGVEVESVAGEENPIKSPVACPLLSNEDTPRKKQRLAWGQGLAKFEKKKVDVPLDSTGNSSLVKCASSPKVILDDTGTKRIPEGTSPITPGSVASPVLEETFWRTYHPGLDVNLVKVKLPVHVEIVSRYCLLEHLVRKEYESFQSEAEIGQSTSLGSQSRHPFILGADQRRSQGIMF